MSVKYLSLCFMSQGFNWNLLLWYVCWRENWPFCCLCHYYQLSHFYNHCYPSHSHHLLLLLMVQRQTPSSPETPARITSYFIFTYRLLFLDELPLSLVSRNLNPAQFIPTPGLPEVETTNAASLYPVQQTQNALLWDS